MRRALLAAAAALLWGAPPAGAQGTLVFHQTFGAENDLYTMPAVPGAPSTPLVTGLGSQQAPNFSPDGETVVYEQDTNNYDIYTVPTRGGSPVPVLATANLEGLPSFDRTGTRIAYQGNDLSDYKIFIAGADGSSPTPFSDNGPVSSNDSDPDWSASVDDVLFWQSNRSGSDQIYAGGHDAGPDALPLTASGTNSQAAYSPVGNRIAFVSTRDSGDPEIYVMNADGGGQTRITTNPGPDTNPAWSPDGTKLAFASVRDGESDTDIFVVDVADPSAATQLNPEDDLHQGGLDWSAVDLSPPVVSVADAATAEGAAAEFTVSLDRPAGTAVAVAWAAAPGTASPGDFTVADGTVSFARGEQTRTISVATTQDAVDEPAETFSVTLSAPDGATLGDATATGTITDDDGAPPATVAPPAPVAGPAQAPVPDENRTVVAEPVTGKVLVKLPGSRTFVDLASVKEIPNGTILDTRRGRVEIAAAGGGQAEFYAGVFRIKQASGLTTLTLQGAIGPCPRARATTAARKKKRRLWGVGKGRFRTAGKYASATVRGTTWMVEDSCSGTLTRVRQGSVTVRDNVKRRTVVVRSGRRYLAKPRTRR